MKTYKILTVLGFAVLVVSLLMLFSDTQAEEKSPPGLSKNSFDYTLYGKTLKQYVDDKGLVNYKGLKTGRKDLDDFNASLGKVKKKEYELWKSDEKIAFLINAYNSLTLQAIIDNYPIKKGGFFASRKYPHNSIRQISGVWDDIEFKVLGENMTLEHIEHKILRKKFNQPYIHMALVCAALSCPRLRNEPYEAAEMKEQFKDQTVDFLNNKLKFRIDRKENEVYISAIFNWFDSDFTKTYKTSKSEFKGHGSDDRAVLNFIYQHLSGPDKEYLKNTEFDIEYLDYDWTLNEQKKKL